MRRNIAAIYTAYALPKRLAKKSASLTCSCLTNPREGSLPLVCMSKTAEIAQAVVFFSCGQSALMTGRM